MAVEEIEKVAQLEQEMKQRKEAAVAEGKQRVLEAQRLAAVSWRSPVRRRSSRSGR